MINYWITDSKTFNYSSDSDDPIDILINVDEFNINKLSSKIQLIKNVNYFTSMNSGWYSKNVSIFNLNTNEEITFVLIGEIEKLLSEENKIKYDKYVKLFNLIEDTELCDIMNRNGSDKGNSHNYTKYYTQIFEKYKKYDINLFELGLGTNNDEFQFNMGKNGVPGASLFGWSEYFKFANIYGADIDSKCLFNTNRIKTFYCDQTDAWIIKQLWDNKYLDFKFDIIIEDGLHQFDANISFFENSYHKLNYNGIFIIEDIDGSEIINWLNKIEEYETKFPQFYFEIIKLQCDNNKPDNNLIKITYR